MQKVKFEHSPHGIEEFAEYYHDHADEIFELSQTARSQYPCGELYCNLSNGIWDEDKLGEFKGEMFVHVLTQYLLFTTSPYALLKYNALHSPHLEKNLTEEEFDKMALEEIYNEWYMSNHQEYMRIFFGEALMNVQANQSHIHILGIVDDDK